MPAQYPFIDVAVHDLIRPRLARGEALALFAPGLDRALWCNGAGAQFFGSASIYDFLEDGPVRSDITFRQIETVARQLTTVGESRSLMLRVTSGFQKLPVTATLECIAVRKGEPVILLAVPAVKRATGDVRLLASELMSGFDDPDTHMAVIDGDGAVIASSEGFAGLGITPQTARMLVNLVEADADRLVKRPIPTGRGYLPAAIGKISDAPALHLLFTVETILGQMDPSDGFSDDADADLPTALAEPVRADDTVEDEIETEDADHPEDETFVDGPETSSPTARFDSVIAALGDIEEIEPDTDELDEQAEPDPTNEDDAAVILDTPAYDSVDNDDNAGEVVAEDTVDPTTDTLQTADEVPMQPAEMSPAEPPAPAEVPTQAPIAAMAQSGETFVFSQDRRASRFVWKIDAEGRFSEVSPEFAQAVGPRAADINGVAFSDLAALFNLDPEGKIGELLKKRDTWSGKTIYWPVEGTRLVVPVDLAALPTYTRNRDFDGFRGFGIVRVADAQEDPDAIGMTFVRAELSSEADSVMHETAHHDREDELEEFLTELSEGESHPPEDFVEEQIADAGEETLDARLLDAAAEEGDEDIDAIDGDGDDGETEDLEQPQENELPVERPATFEPPVLRIMEPRKPSLPDKVVQLEEHRTRNRDSLTPGEQAAFNEIARKLDPLGLRARVEQSLNPSEPAALRPAPQAPEKQIDDRSQVDSTPETPPVQSEPTKPEPLVGLTPPDMPTERITAKRERSLTAEIIDLMPVALLVHVGDRLIHANPEFFNLTGYKTLDELERAGGLETLIQRQDLETPGDEAGQVVALCADERLLPVTARLQSVRFEETTALMLALIAQPEEAARSEPEPPVQTIAPVSTPAQAGELARLKVEVDELRSILETATDGVVILDSDGDIRSMNRAASALFNFDDMETRGKPFVMLFAHESQKSILDYLNGLSGHGVASVLNDGREVIGREASGGFLPMFMTIGKLNSSNGYCAVIRDITQWKRTEEELRNAKRAAETANAHKTDFLARVSHEIRTPLNAIIGFADMMANEHFGPVGHPRYGEYAHDIVRSGRHVLDIVNDLLDISKIEAGEMELDFSSVGLNEMVQAAVSIVQPQANSQRVIIRTALSQAVPNVVADGRSIKQIVLNILANAIRFTPSGGQIIVSSAYEPNGSVVLRIRDTGIGMSRSELEQAMKPFRQVSTGTPRNRGEGTGLGLPLTKAMVDANRAQFAISSTPNEGTLVEVTFPSPRVLAD
ncbi:PAS domain S-box-containing protein [Peteryoungia aggregata LMG 23059]|uniref:histidine kinase n=1 Tax=Peteryoungia aggregata LMG 23059 TaxID=1368425 RepID=A0ABU0G3Q3_9HYPH|nr:ATP-binding protein [Peteryoungia aggregata]MDQ0419738.1 PAS domain S-box-containing protein [Peteryoungia aggregata LMG 23059]